MFLLITEEIVDRDAREFPNILLHVDAMVAVHALKILRISSSE
jgi:hypothetical protein